jgi:tripartite-type tricarboxylate transporter receptor subunit TctC
MQCRTDVGVTIRLRVDYRTAVAAASALVLAACAAPSASAQSIADFYNGKSVTLVVGSGVGGGYDVNSRLLARHMSRHIPGEPHIIVQNMPAASGIAALNHIYNIAPRDGTVFSAVINNMPYDPLFGGPAAKFDVFQLNWLGSLSKQTNVCLAWKASAFKSLDDVMQQKMRVSATGVTGWRSFLPRLFNGVAGTRFEVINGYDSPGSMLAVERGEVDGICADYATVKANQSNWITQDKIVVLAQFGLTLLAGLEHVPMGIDRVKDELDRQAVRLFMSQQEFGRPYVMPPGVPQERLAAMRAAFEATVTDTAFLEEAQKIQMDVSPLTGAELDKLFQEAYAASPEVVARTKVLLQRAGAL